MLTTVVSTVAHRALGEEARGVPAPDHRRWWVVVRQGDDVVGIAMRTAPFAPYPLFVLPMPEAGARAIARALHERGEEVCGVNGALPAAQVLVEPAPVGGRLRLARQDDLERERVHVTGVNPPSFGVARIGPVYTPAEHRGRGYASAAVAAVSRRLLADGSRVCLFTDQANPTSNKIYQQLGFRPVVDMANLLVDGAGPT